jgi:hypothetical protein
MKTFLPLLIIASLAISASAQTTTPGTGTTNATDSASNVAFWQASFANGGHYLVKLNAIQTASKHEYVSDAAARVVEVNIGTSSSIVSRIYFLEPVGKDTPIAAGQIIMNRAQDVAQQVASRVSPNAAKLNVVKNYPTSTHAHTVEFVVQDEATLNSLYTSLMAAINTGKGRTWSETGGSTTSNTPTAPGN